MQLKLNKPNRLFVLMIMLFAFMPLSMRAQEFRHAIKLEPFSILKQQYFQIGYEYALDENRALGIMIGPTYGSTADSPISSGLNGISIDPNLKFFTQGTWGGFYVGLHTSFRYRVETLQSGDGWFYPTDYYDINFNFHQGEDPNYQTGDTYKKVIGKILFVPQLGYSKVSSSGFLVDIYFGMGYKYSSRVYSNNRTGVRVASRPSSGVATRGNLSLGWAF